MVATILACATLHEMRSAASFRVDMDGESFLVGFDNQLHHLVVVMLPRIIVCFIVDIILLKFRMLSPRGLYYE